MSTLYDFRYRALNGEERALAEHRGKALLIVNTASRCGFTGQYAALEALHRRYQAQGLVIIGFPCNQFGRQEPDDAAAIGAFCRKNYGVGFAMADKVDVNGPNAHPLWRYLCQQQPGLFGSARIKWNFTKFLIGRDGRIASRHAPLIGPERLSGRIETLLAE
ncbi:glutathione peroxidase [Xenophilus sp. AP218F]|nr:glutathione peroxidase [Xenophilus sp. AP218F]